MEERLNLVRHIFPLLLRFIRWVYKEIESEEQLGSKATTERKTNELKHWSVIAIS